jgi:4-deoxy-L-threo-5-hexosulose-uronate ketol-isomerase
MEKMRIIHSVHPEDFIHYSASRIRERFLVKDLVQAGKINFIFTHYNRLMMGVAVPLKKPLELEKDPILQSDYFLQERELGIINVGGDAVVMAGKKKYKLEKLDCLYIGKGTEKVSFISRNRDVPAVLYLLSAPAHATYPTTVLKKQEAASSPPGSLESGSQRAVCRYIHKNGIKSCQLVMGLTILEKGNVWNTIPPPITQRQMEVYFYFGIPENQAVFHYLGEPVDTRQILIENYQALAAPPWSIHAGSGACDYGFIWGMAGENLQYSGRGDVLLFDLD